MNGFKDSLIYKYKRLSLLLKMNQAEMDPQKYFIQVKSSRSMNIDT